MKLIHYSGEKIETLDLDEEYDQAITLRNDKPKGLWVSVESSGFGDNNHNWKEWCQSEEYQLENLQISYEITLNDNANILHLKTSQDIFDFTKLWKLPTRDFDHETDTYHLNWLKIKKIYQGIIIAPYQWKCRLSLESAWYYGWDCSSGCLWDLKCIKEFKLRENDVVD